MIIMTDMCEKGTQYSESELKQISAGETVLMEFPFSYNPNNPEQYRDKSIVEVTWLGLHRSKIYYEVKHKTGRKTNVYPGTGNLYAFYRCEAGDPMPLEGGRRRRMRRKTKSTKKHLRRSHRRLKSLN